MVKSGMVATREAAVALGRQWMQEYNLFEHVLRHHDFDDQHLFFRFVKKNHRFNPLSNISNPFARTIYDVDIHLLSDGDSSDSSFSGSQSIDGSFAAPFRLNFPRSSTTSGTAAGILQENFIIDATEETSHMKDESFGGAETTLTDLTSGSDGTPRLHGLREVEEAMELNIRVGRRRWRFNTYDNCFVAKDAVTYLVEGGFAPNRASAVRLGKKIQHELNSYQHVCQEHDFADEHYFFRFTPKHQRFGEKVMVELPLEEIATKFEQGVRMRTNTYRMKSYPKTFVGEQAVDYLVQSRLTGSRRAAVRLGRALVEQYGLFVKVTGDMDFADDKFLFRFVPKDKRKDQSTADKTSSLGESVATIRYDHEHEASSSDQGPELPKKPEFIFSSEGLKKIQLAEIAESFRTGVKVQSNRYRARIYPRTFVGSQAVTYLVNSSWAPSRKEAVDLGRRLQRELKLFQHVKEQHEFKDDYLFYKFTDQDPEDDTNGSSLMGTSEIATSCNAESLVPLDTIADMMQRGVRTKDRRYNLKSYKNW